MNLSAIMVLLSSDNLQDGIDALQALPGVEVHHTDPATGRVIVVQEAAVIHDEVDGLKAIKALPQVKLAELVYHYFEEDNSLITELPADIDQQEGLSQAAVPDYLNS